jgi:hypothetical protein
MLPPDSRLLLLDALRPQLAFVSIGLSQLRLRLILKRR